MAAGQPGRARVIYQSEALYVGTADATGYHFTAAHAGQSDAKFMGSCTGFNTKALALAEDADAEIRTGIQQLRRVQSANYSFTLNRQDVNQFGQLARIDAVSIDPPTVSLDYSYYLTNGINEKLIGFNVSGTKSAFTDEFLDGGTSQLGGADGHNFFILTTSQGKDAVGNTESEEGKTVIALGNGYVSNYSMEASVGGMPTATVTVDGLNLKSYTGISDHLIPAVNTNFGTPMRSTQFSLPPAISGVLNDSAADVSAETEGWSCLRPGDITLHLGTDGRAGEFEVLPAADPEADYNKGSCHIQSFSIDVPVGRTPLQRLGTPYGYTRVVDFPVTISVSVNAILADLKQGSVDELIWNTEEHDLVFTLREPDQYGTGHKAIEYRVKGALLEGESFSSSIGDNKSVDLTFTAQLGGPEDQARGLRISGSRNALTIQNNYESFQGPAFPV